MPRLQAKSFATTTDAREMPRARVSMVSLDDAGTHALKGLERARRRSRLVVDGAS